MRKYLETIILAIILLICLAILSLLVVELIPTECKHELCEKTITDPTCTEGGSTLYTCVDCGFSYTGDLLEALGHDYTSEVIEPTCTESGHTVHTCSRCNDEYTDTETDAAGHSLKSTVVEPTCTEKGYTVHKCESCDYEKKTDEVEALGHAEVIDEAVAPTCTENGLTEGKHCSVCEAVLEEQQTVSATGHTTSSTTVKPTCTTDGYTLTKCTNNGCAYSEKTSEKEALGHDLVAQAPTLPTCDRDGYTLYSCSRCSYSEKKDFVDAYGHTYIDTVIDPTCTEDGYTLHVCDDCGDEYQDAPVEKLDHDFSVITVKEPTCTEGGYTNHQCSRCVSNYNDTETVALGHDLSKEETFAATTEAAGYKKISCANGDCTEHYIIDGEFALEGEHTFVKTTIVHPTFDKQGYSVYTCSDENCTLESFHYDHVFYSDVFGGYTHDPSYTAVFGLDLSKWSGDVDFAALKNAGVEFVIIRVGSYTNKDPRFEEYYAAAKAAGLDVGVYFFTYAENKQDAINDARNVASWLVGKKLEYPVYLDVEDVDTEDVYQQYYPSMFDKTVMLEIVQTFMKEMVSYGYFPGLYTNQKFMELFFEDDEFLADHDIWLAHWAFNAGGANDPVLDGSEDYSDYLETKGEIYKEIYSMWQYQGEISGYLGGAVALKCDLNISYRDFEAIIKKYGFNGFTEPEIEAPAVSVMTWEEFVAAENGSEIVIEGYVQGKQSFYDNKCTVYLQDESHGYFVYELACTEQEYAQLTVGTKIRVTGEKAVWSGLHEVVSPTFEIVEGSYVAAPVDVTDKLGTSELISYQSMLVEIKDMTVVGIDYKNGMPGDDIYVTLSHNGNEYVFTVEVNLTGTETELYDLAMALTAGDLVDVIGFASWYEGEIELHLTGITVK